MAGLLLEAGGGSKRLQIMVAPDAVAARLAQEVDIVLLGADRITSTGDVSNKIGSLTVALGAAHGKNVQVVVASDVDKIVAPGQDHGPTERHPASEITAAWPEHARQALGDKITVFGEWFEWVPSNLIDVYISDEGVLDREKVAEFGKHIALMQQQIFKGT
ncbi:nagb/rpia/CoA transferase-like protein [Amniculicola lignicola CBS 123094]|uniref:Nagb/rpia/CoA transferase-like protein n=1 Tax=Amniculicola lignicola CBS 123094 TaxID=1392246 RepID=A0A6A5WS36_9PLEO|nr:nagb/rpia/CoA transferase-like protein [Amniculicola lignicola CBS 123094]